MKGMKDVERVRRGEGGCCATTKILRLVSSGALDIKGMKEVKGFRRR